MEATAFTEVGFHGKDVDTIIKDLVEVRAQHACVGATVLRAWAQVAIGNERAKRNKAPAATADNAVIEDALLDALLGPNFNKDGREAFRKLLRQGVLEDREITVELPRNSAAARSGEAEHGLPQDMIVHLFSVVGEDGPQVNKKTVSRKTTVREARSLLAQAQAGNEEDLVAAAIRSVEENGIVVLDEIDKVCVSRDGVQYSGDASSEGVQRDLLPLIEGTRVTTKHGDVNTAKVLFIAAGAFTACKPSDLLAELQGRLPVRVELAPLSEADLHRILTETKNNLIAQQVALLATEGIQLTVEPAAVRRMAAIAHTLNTTVRNIGARRLHTVVEAVFEDVSFECAPGPVTVDVAMVEKRLASLMTNVDLRKSLL